MLSLILPVVLWFFSGTAGAQVAAEFWLKSGDRVVFSAIASRSSASTLSQTVDTATSFKIEPLHPVGELRAEALKASPPKETGDFLPADLVELKKLDPTIKLEIRYATTNNFMGTPMYTQARAFMQRPAAEAVVRANKKLRAHGFGLLIHDGYRPWYVTKMFWDATPEDKHIFVANPAEGSKHNRGCAVDLSMYDLKTGRAVSMPSGYDEMSPRAFSDYAGGTPEENEHRAILKKAVEDEGFTQLPKEWWHFDYKDWKRYRIGNVDFKNIK